jgi:hypothetical protein
MTRFYEFWSKYGKWFGLAFTALVVGLLVYLHVFGTPVVPQLRQPASNTPDMWVCTEDGLDWVDEDLFKKVDEFWTAHGHPIGVLKRVPCASIAQCEFGDRRMAPCEPNNIVVALRDKWFDEEHAGETLSVFDVNTRKTRWSTILVPKKILGPDGFGEFGAEVPMLPPDAEAIVMAHEVGHWFGYDHVVTRIAGPFFSEPTGHVLNRSIMKAGWGAEGLPETK